MFTGQQRLGTLIDLQQVKTRFSTSYYTLRLCVAIPNGFPLDGNDSSVTDGQMSFVMAAFSSERLVCLFAKLSLG